MRLTDHFSLEMSVSFQARADDVFQTLDYPSKKKKGVGSISTYYSFFKKNQDKFLDQGNETAVMISTGS